MAFDAYSPCPCGSGKKFKWCCQPIHVQIDKAFRLDADGQHEAAFRIMDEVTTAHPSNPEAWGRTAQLLYQNGRLDEAENALQKALEINPQYPFGYLLRGMFRQQEGERAGALLLFRKAAELYDPDAKDILAQVYSLIADAELKSNRPVAARAALKMCLHLRPNDELSKEMEEIFGAKSRLPMAARREYTFMSPPVSASVERRAAWDRSLAGTTKGKLTDAARAFEQLTAENPDDAAAQYNLALTRAWLGENRGALEALTNYVHLEPDESRAASAWALGEVLRFGQGMEDQADYIEHSALFQIRDPQRLFNLLQEWQRDNHLTAVQVRQEDGLVTGLIMDRAGLVTAGTAANPYPKLGAYLLIVGEVVRLWSTNEEALERARQDLQQSVGPGLSEVRLVRGPAHFGDVFAEALVFPIGVADHEEAEKQVREHVQRYFEETWIHRPLHSLNNIPPIDAAGHATLRKQLLGVVQFLQECAASVPPAYDFDRLRRKLGLLTGGAPVAQPGAAAAPVEIAAMNAAELAALRPETLTDEQVEQAYQVAQKLDARELASHFAKAIVDRPPRPDRPDRFPWYTYLVQTALAEGDTQTALQYVDEGEKADCEQNEGRRRNDYELRRAQVLAKRGDGESARDVLERLIARVPDELRYCGTAAESMLSLKQGAAALHFAEQGLAKARQKNDRESEQYFLELLGAAKKQGTS
jgi:tetratricopeptide (TPR) repeat protein